MPELEDEKDSPGKKVILNKEGLDQIAKNALNNGFIGLDHLIYIMAGDNRYSDILYRLWKVFQCNRRGPEEVDVDSEGGGAGRIRLWFDLLHQWCGMGVQGVRAGLADIALLPLYKFDSTTGAPRKVKYLGYERGVDYVRLDDLKEYLEKIDIPLPERLFPSICPGDFTSPGNIFRQEGDVWFVCFSGKGFRLSNMIGLKYIHLLLDHANKILYAFDLVNMKMHPSAIPATDGSEEARESIDKMAKTKFSPEEEENDEEGWREDEAQGGEQDKKHDEDLASTLSCKGKTAGTLLNREGLKVSSSIDRNYRIIDSQTKDKYRFRLQQIEEQLQGRNNPEQELALAEEKALLEGEVNRFARSVSSGSDEKARKSVSEACRRAYKEIGKHNPSLQGYLSRHIKLGNRCMYQPDPSHPVSWILE